MSPVSQRAFFCFDDGSRMPNSVVLERDCQYAVRCSRVPSAYSAVCRSATLISQGRPVPAFVRVFIPPQTTDALGRLYIVSILLQIGFQALQMLLREVPRVA